MAVSRARDARAAAGISGPAFGVDWGCKKVGVPIWVPKD